jgi:hypothetical protein
LCVNGNDLLHDRRKVFISFEKSTEDLLFVLTDVLDLKHFNGVLKKTPDLKESDREKN